MNTTKRPTWREPMVWLMLGLPLADHITNCITFMRERADALGLRGSL